MATIRENVNTLITQITAIADKIRSLSGTAADITPSEMPQKIQDIYDNANVNIPPKDYNFFDWDGTLLYSYTAAELNALTELPPMPTHDNVAAIEWNYTLAQLKSLTMLSKPFPANVGAIYGAPDGISTILWINIPDGDTIRNIDLGISANTGISVNVDWGDNSTSTIAESGGTITETHTYSSNCDYVITITPNSATDLIFNGSFIIGSKSRQFGYLKKVVLGKMQTNITSTTNVYLFYKQYNIEIFSFGNLPITTYTPRNMFNGCNNLKAIHFPSTLTNITTYAGNNCGAKVVTIPYGITTIANSAFMGSPELEFLALPKSLTSVGDYPFSGTSIKKLIFPENTYSTFGIACGQMALLQEVSFPSTRTLIPAYFFVLTSAVFSSGGTIPYLYIPPTVNTLAANAFYQRGAGSTRVMDFRDHTSVPTLGAADGAQAAVYIVPDDLYSTWITATNWAAKASSIVKASDYSD